MSASAIAAYVQERSITEVLHFTTDKGLLGILAKNAVLPRDQLDSDQYIEHIYTPNCADRMKDAAWTGYVNLSISRVNGHMLGRSHSWHDDGTVWWTVLAFDPSILADAGVYFATTNNTYHNCVKRAEGVAGLVALFAESVEWGYYGYRKTRHAGIHPAWPTDPQAEVLYPGSVPLGYLRAIYVRDGDHLDHINGLLGVFADVPQGVSVSVKPEVFR